MSGIRFRSSSVRRQGCHVSLPPGRRGKFDLRHRCISVLHSGRALAAENSAVSFSHAGQKGQQKSRGRKPSA
nr:MAG TPA: hypothetical protein [Caudoviricetes sp.]